HFGSLCIVTVDTWPPTSVNAFSTGKGKSRLSSEVWIRLMPEITNEGDYWSDGDSRRCRISLITSHLHLIRVFNESQSSLQRSTNDAQTTP
ncbi:hypothetical protein WG66_002666, partial [Moniliophthora roreri]